MNTTTITAADTYNVRRLMPLPRWEKLRIIAVLTSSLQEGEDKPAPAEDWADKFLWLLEGYIKTKPHSLRELRDYGD